eukprot:3289585-Prymnesium_polylepis.1
MCGVCTHSLHWSVSRSTRHSRLAVSHRSGSRVQRPHVPGAHEFRSLQTCNTQQRSTRSRVPLIPTFQHGNPTPIPQA